MAVLTWDNVGERLFETGVDRGVLYIPTAGIYDTAGTVLRPLLNPLRVLRLRPSTRTTSST